VIFFSYLKRVADWLDCFTFVETNFSKQILLIDLYLLRYLCCCVLRLTNAVLFSNAARIAFIMGYVLCLAWQLVS